MEVKGDRERIKASWVSISRVEASCEDSSGSEEGDRLHGRPCIPLASQKQRWKARTSRNKARRRRMFLIVSLAIFIRRGFICQLVVPLPLFFRLLLHSSAFLSARPDPKHVRVLGLFSMMSRNVSQPSRGQQPTSSGADFWLVL